MSGQGKAKSSNPGFRKLLNVLNCEWVSRISGGRTGIQDINHGPPEPVELL